MENNGVMHCISCAREEVQKGSFDKAFDLYNDAFTQYPHIKEEYEQEFREVVLRLNDFQADVHVKFMYFTLAISHFPQNALYRNDLGTYSYECGFYTTAWHSFENALVIDPKYVRAEKNLNSLKNIMVERWHFRMLNDNIRNESYQRAIHESILSSEDTVLDVGTGTGLLAIYATETCAKKVIGCDGSATMCLLAEEILSKNNIKNVSIINKLSWELNAVDYGGKFSVLITEMFDAGLLGEHVLQMLSDAWNHLLTKNARIVPNAAEFFLLGVQSDSLNRKYQLSSETKEILNIQSLNVHMNTDGETYDSEDVHLIKDLKYLTESSSVFKIDFNNQVDIHNMIHTIQQNKVELKVLSSGVMNAVVGWFNLYLSDTITVTTNPTAIDRANAWQQAVFADIIPEEVQQNETIHTNCLVKYGQISIAQEPNVCVTRVSNNIIRFLNDTEYLKTITDSINLACGQLEQIAELSQITVADFCPFPFFGLQMLKKGARSLLCCAKNEDDKNFFVHVFRANGILTNEVTIIYGEQWTSDILNDEKYHVIFNHPFDVCGDLSESMLETGEIIKQKHLLPGGLFLPYKIKIVAQLISSRWVDLNNRLFDENINNLIMAQSVNKYMVTQNFHIDFQALRFVPMSQPEVIINTPGNENNHCFVMTITEGYGNALLCWYSIELMENIKPISTNRSQSFMDGILFLTNFQRMVSSNTVLKIVENRDSDGCFKLKLQYVGESCIMT